ATTHAVPALQGPGHLRLLHLEPAGLGHGNRPVPGWPRIETGRRPPEPTGNVEGRSETGDQVEPLHDRSSNRVVGKGRPCNCRSGRGPLPDSHYPGGRVPHPPLQRILPETLSRANSRPLSVHEGTVLAPRLTRGGPSMIRACGLHSLHHADAGEPTPVTTGSTTTGMKSYVPSSRSIASSREHTKVEPRIFTRADSFVKNSYTSGVTLSSPLDRQRTRIRAGGIFVALETSSIAAFRAC